MTFVLPEVSGTGNRIATSPCGFGWRPKPTGAGRCGNINSNPETWRYSLRDRRTRIYSMFGCLLRRVLDGPNHSASTNRKSIPRARFSGGPYADSREQYRLRRSSAGRPSSHAALALLRPADIFATPRFSVPTHIVFGYGGLQMRWKGGEAQVNAGFAEQYRSVAGQWDLTEGGPIGFLADGERAGLTRFRWALSVLPGVRGCSTRADPAAVTR